MSAIAAKLQALKKFRKTDNLCSTEEFLLATKAPYPNSPHQQSYISLRECGVTSKQYLLVDIFVNSHYLSDWQCIKIVRWIKILVTFVDVCFVILQDQTGFKIQDAFCGGQVQTSLSVAWTALNRMSGGVAGIPGAVLRRVFQISQGCTSHRYTRLFVFLGCCSQANGFHKV